jgi:hypothetical protein
MDLKDLIARGALVQNPPTPRDVTWTPPDGDPITFTAYIKAPSSGWLDRARMAAARDMDRISYRTAIISHAISFRDDDGKEWAFSYEQAYVLKNELAQALEDAYNAVNAPPPRPPEDADKQEAFAKNSEPMPGSGTNSHGPASADEPLPRLGNA